MTIIQEYAEALGRAGMKNGTDFPFAVRPIPGEVDVLQIVVPGREEVPIYMSFSGSQLLCIAHLFRDHDVLPESKMEMIEEMLWQNIPMPLSSFGKMGDLYVVFGAMAANSPLDDILFELKTLSENSIQAINLMRRFVVS